MTWQQAEESCRQVGKDAHLVSIQTMEQISWLTEAIDREMQIKGKSLYTLFPKNSPWFDSGWWIGLGQLCPKSQSDQMPSFRWTDGKLFANDKLIIGDVKLTVPKSNKWDNHYCVFYDFQKSPTGLATHRTFNITTCSDRRRFICQMPAFSQDQLSSGGSAIVTEEEVEITESANSELTADFPCGVDPLFCPLKTSQGTVCYRLQTEPFYWEQAMKECDAKHQSDLTSIHSKEEANFIYEMVQLQPSISGETKYWIGLHRRNAQSQYEWSDGSSFDYLLERLRNDDPDEERGICVAIQFNVSTKLLQKQPLYNLFGVPIQVTKNTPAYFWTHQRCDNRHLAICRKPGFDYHSRFELSAKEERRLKKQSNWKCSNGYKLFRGMCYKLYGTNNNGVTFSEAIQRCKNEKANLVSLTDMYENGFVTSMLQNLNSNAWIGMDMTDGRVRWLDGEPLKLIRFGPDNRVIRIGGDRHIFQNVGEPGFSNEACVALDATNMVGYWNIIFNKTNYVFPSGSTKADNKSNQCDTMELPYICETYADESANVIQNKKTCNEIDDITYCFLLNDPNKHINGHFNFVDASEICATLPTKYTNYGRKYGQLAQADNIFEWLFLTAMALENDYDEFFMGIRFRKSVGFERTDNLRLRLAPWDIGEPNLKNGNCVVLKIGRNGPAWYIDDCMKRKPIVCRLTNEEPMSMVPQTVRCPDGKEDWILGETHCYHLVSNTSMFSSGFKADHDCFKYFNATLASFETQKDFELFKSHILHNELSVSNALIGLIRQQHGSYAWKDLSPVTFLNWAEDEPADTKGRIIQQCVKMQLNGNYTWHSLSCWQSTHFLCSTPVVNVNYNPSARENDKNEGFSSQQLSYDKERNSRKKLPNDYDSYSSKTDQSLLPVPSTQSISAISTFGEICLVLIVALSIVGGIQLWKRKRRLRLSSQRIVQFDQLQNEEENTM
ncbi:Uncharacterized protein BM_BM8663 [Brugia malayi]|nr:Uncharacterized protein BM_BM8663 [Brugia malayi]VIO90178.1 Uncharacterized protein BM_BM8663 [Brugia malayi]